jgi:hypothetical protein
VKLKANELTGAALDWAVAKCEGMVPNTPFIASNKEYTFKPSTDWAQGGPIIERERDSLRLNTSQTRIDMGAASAMA